MATFTLDWNKYTDTAIRAAEEGSVLLKNDREALPVKPGTKAALFGRMQSHYFKSGTGSGGMVNVNHVTDSREALANDPDIILDGELISIYDEWEDKNPIDKGVGWGKEPWSQDEMPLTESVVRAAASRNDVAVIVIARTAGEDRDNTAEKGSFFLRDSEEEMLKIVCGVFEKTIVLLNVGNTVDMSFVTKYDPAAVLYIWQAGMIGGIAAANLITGKAAPSGGLTDTIAYDLADHPSSGNFGGKDSFKDIYAEDIYVGYRYFSTFAQDKVMYPFGFGLTYTEHTISDARADGSSSVTFTITNTGNAAGAKAVLLFVEAPAGKLAKPSRVLVGFAKSDVLAPGDSQTLTIAADRRNYASYDDDGRAGLGTGWILEAGEYSFLLGTDVVTATKVGSFTVDESVNIEPLESALKPVEAFERMTSAADGSLAYEPAPLREVEKVDSRFERLTPEIAYTGDQGITLSDVKAGRKSMDEFIAQLPDEELSLVIRGEGMSSPKVTTGTAAAFGGNSKMLREHGVPTLCCSDGPSGMRIDSGKKAFALPNGTCLASTFNTALITELFTHFGKEMISNEIDAILGPGINIHRHPLNGRNFEYFSEDPYLSGVMACAQLEGLHKIGTRAVIKHFCANNRETNRRLCDAVVSERALREIYLRPFEIAVKEGGAKSIMTVYNLINGTYGAMNYELNTTILREQWGFTGITMTDWWAFVDKESVSDMHFGIRNHSFMARAQNDIYMVCPKVELDHLDDTDVYESLKSGATDRITRAELQRNCANILRYAMTTPAMDRVEGNAPTVEHIDCPFAEDKIEAKVDVYYDITEDPIIRVDTDTSTGDDYTFGVTCLKPGRYDMIIHAESELNELAQIPMTLFYTSIPFRVITWNGTNGREDTRETDIRLYQTYSIFRAHFGAPGVKLKYIEFVFRCSPEEDTTFEL